MVDKKKRLTAEQSTVTMQAFFSHFRARWAYSIISMTLVDSTYYLGDQRKENEIGGAHCTYGKQKCAQGFGADT